MMNRVVKVGCILLLPLFSGCASIDAFLFDANPDGTPISHNQQQAAPSQVTPVVTQNQAPSIDSGKSNDELRAQNEAMKIELKAAEDELVRLHKVTKIPAAPAVLEPTDRLWARISFKSGQTSVEPKTRKVLTAIAGKFLANPGRMHLEVKGYSDDEPVGGYKQSHQPRHHLKTLEALTQARADAVAAVMIDAGIPAKLVHARGMGATGFVSDNNTAAGRSQNRRVDIHLVSNYE